MRHDWVKGETEQKPVKVQLPNRAAPRVVERAPERKRVGIYVTPFHQALLRAAQDHYIAQGGASRTAATEHAIELLARDQGIDF
jgi:hypothetical protein